MRSPPSSFGSVLAGLASLLTLILGLLALGWVSWRLETIPDLSLPSWGAADAPLVVVDAGHGGYDGGAVANGIVEKTLSLQLARLLQQELAEAGVRVLMTRSTDRFLELEERCQIAAEARAAAFVSLHLNTSSAPGVSGIETYYSSHTGLVFGQVRGEPRKARAAEALARLVQRRAVASVEAEDRGIKDSQILVVKRSPCPAVLVECGFLTNKEEANLLSRKSYQNQLVRGIREGVVEFLKGMPIPLPVGKMQLDY
jgi:N-acetylmuramoyl-L-alanine amidase